MRERLLAAMCVAAGCTGGGGQLAQPVCTTSAPTVAGTPLPPPVPTSSFVTRVGSTLELDGQRFRFAGANAYWLGLDEWHVVDYPTPFRQADALGLAVEMGFAVVRAHTLGISTGNALSFEPSLGVFNDEALRAADHAIAIAGALGLRLVVPLTDNWKYFHGGRYDFTDWRNRDGDEFFTDATVRADFKQYVAALLTHVNVETGVAYKDDPTIMAWELGNELTPAGGAAVLRDFTADLAAHLKALAPQQLVVDGWAGLSPDAGLLAIDAVDVHTLHMYGADVDAATVTAAAATVRTAGKVFWIGEYDWTIGKPADLDALLVALLGNDDVDGDLLWNLWPHDDQAGYVVHGERYDFHPPGTNPGQEARVAALRTHAFAMRGAATATWSPPPPPLPRWDASTHTLTWRGAGATAAYSVENAAAIGGPFVAWCEACLTDRLPTTDELPLDQYVRMIPIACDGTRGAASITVLTASK